MTLPAFHRGRFTPAFRSAGILLTVSILGGVPFVGVAPPPLAAAPGGAPAAAYAVAPRALDAGLTLVNQDGQPVRLGDFAGKALLVSFGYTRCPDVCPLTFALLARVYRQLGPAAERSAVAFVTLDPQRDTPALLGTYVRHFHAGFHGLGGSRAQVDAVADAFGARYRIRTNAEGKGYSVSHTTYTYLLDGEGRLRYAFPFDTAADVIADGVRRVLRPLPQPAPNPVPGRAR